VRLLSPAFFLASGVILEQEYDVGITLDSSPDS
jgi:hypothetical protein